MNTRDVLAGAGIGAAVAFMLDPGRGRRRRALLRDKVAHATRKTREGLEATARDVGNRARGVAAEARGRLAADVVDDERLVDRVRAQLGRAASHARAIDVRAQNREVTLRGPILAREVDGLLATVAAVRGVQRVINELEPHETAEGIPSLQGHRRMAAAPARRALLGAGAIATAACVAAYARRSHAGPQA